MLGWLFKRTPQKRIVDPVFGDLLWQPMKDPDDSYWDGRCRLPQFATEVDLLIAAGEAGPGPAQYSFYGELKVRFPELLLLVTPIVWRELTSHWLRGFESIDSVVLELDMISFPHIIFDTMSWEMTFGSSHTEELAITVHMRGWSPTGQVSTMH